LRCRQFSQHVYDQSPSSVAADLVFAKGAPAQWAKSARWRFNTKLRWRRGKSWRRGGVGFYPNHGFVHVDSGPRRDWSG
jgi:hypothetical protein